MGNASLFFFLIAILVLGLLIFVAIILKQKGGTKLDKEKYRADLTSIQNSLDKNNTVSYNMAVVEADKLLDRALIEIGARGRTMGERLKWAGNRFSEVNYVWYAHKLRNQIAHEVNFRISYNEAKRALGNFQQALKDLGAI